MLTYKMGCELLEKRCQGFRPDFGMIWRYTPEFLLPGSIGTKQTHQLHSMFQTKNITFLDRVELVCLRGLLPSSAACLWM